MRSSHPSIPVDDVLKKHIGEVSRPAISSSATSDVAATEGVHQAIWSKFVKEFEEIWQ